MDYEMLNKVKRTQLAALTRAKRSGDPAKVVAAVRGARETFERHGFPDQWPTWRIAVDDLNWHSDPAIRAAARTESDAWNL